MKVALIFISLAMTALVSGCRENSLEDYVVLTGRIFVFNYRIAEANYVVTLAKLKPTPEGAKAVGYFDDPAGGQRIMIQKKIWTNNDKIVFESRALHCIVKDKPYKFNIEIVDAEGRVLQKLSSSIVSTLDQSVLPGRPLVIGPGYQRNRELKGPKGGAEFAEKTLPCPRK